MIGSFRGEYNFLSNMHDCQINHLGHMFNSVEHAYMFSKNPLDKDWLNKCLTLSASEIKKQSKSIKLRDDWNDVRLPIMFGLLKQKFSKEPFRSRLINTGNENIVEGNSWGDIFWGVDIKKTPNIGENWMGRLLMDIRNKIRNNKI